MKMHGCMRGLTVGLLFAAAMVATPADARRQAAAEESATRSDEGDARWFAFMPAHFIDRKALKVRRDGLLESASRYPRTSSAGWLAEDNARGRYELLERVVDCETGLYVDVALVLLDGDGKEVARQAMGLEAQLQQIAFRQSDVRGHEWPTNSEITLACELARQPEAQDLEELRRAKPGLGEQPGVFDLAGIGYSPPPDGRGLFTQLQGQYDTYRARFAPPRPPRSSSRAISMDQSGGRWLELGDGYRTKRFDLASLRYVDGRLEVTHESHDYLRPWPLDIDQEQVDVRVNMAIDCRSGLTVPLEQLFYAKGTDTLHHRRSVHVFETWQALSYSAGPIWSEWLGPQEPGEAGQLCRMAAASCNGTSSPAETAFEISPSVLPDEGGAPLVLAAREAWLGHRAGFVPTCRIGGR